MKTPVARSHYSIEDDTWKVVVHVACGNLSPELVGRLIENMLNRIGVEHVSSDPLFVQHQALKRIQHGPRGKD